MLYLGKGIRGAAEEIWMMTILDGKNRPLNVHIEYKVTEHGTKALLVYCQVSVQSVSVKRLNY